MTMSGLPDRPIEILGEERATRTAGYGLRVPASAGALIGEGAGRTAEEGPIRLPQIRRQSCCIR